MKKQPKTEIISTRVTPEQREIIEEKAYSSYRTPSMYLRDCALDKKIIVVKGVDEIEYMRYHGYDVQWEDKYKYITFTSPEGWKVRDNKLFDERFLKDNLEIYFALGGCDSAIIDPYFDYVTPNHPDCYTMTYSDGLINLLGDILSTVPEDFYYQPHYINELNTAEKLRLEKILGRRICNEAFYTYCTREDYEREQGISM